jgi:uncharacterized protein (TIGR02265 family)
MSAALGGVGSRKGSVIRCSVPEEHSRTDHSARRFVEPPWRTVLDPELELSAIPADAMISGMFIAPLLVELKRINASVAFPRARYVPFQFYPLREHAQLLVETASHLFRNRPLRYAMRKMGRAAPLSFISSTLGKVVLGSSQGVHGAVEALATAYGLNMRPGTVTIVESLPERMVLRLENIHYFLDSHHVGAFEGAMTYAGVRGSVRIAAQSRATADLLLEW